MQLWKKQTISAFKSSSKRSKVILIEKHVKPICSRITSTTHSAQIRRRWFAIWVMWSYSSCAKQYRKCNVLNVFSVGIKELCTALADNSWLTANPKESFTNYDWMHPLSRTTWWRKGVAMVLDTVKLKNRKSTIWPGMRGRDAAKELTLKVKITKVFMIVFSETKSVVTHTSHSAGPSKSALSFLYRGIKRYQGQWYLTLNMSGKNAPMRRRPDFRAAVSLKNRLHRESGEQVAEPSSPHQYRRWHSSSSDSWWDTSDWSWSSS